MGTSLLLVIAENNKNIIGELTKRELQLFGHYFIENTTMIFLRGNKPSGLNLADLTNIDMSNPLRL